MSPRRTRMPGADEAREACGVFCLALSEIEAEDEEVRSERREAWLRASELGCTYEELADRCGVSPSLIKQETAKARGATWMKGN